MLTPKIASNAPHATHQHDTQAEYGIATTPRHGPVTLPRFILDKTFSYIRLFEGENPSNSVLAVCLVAGHTHQSHHPLLGAPRMNRTHNHRPRRTLAFGNNTASAIALSTLDHPLSPVGSSSIDVSSADL